jgi:preprotein translocase subunit YajC
MPAYWYAIILVVVATPLYFLLSRPRKRERNARWKG